MAPKYVWSNETMDWSQHLTETVTNEELTAVILWWSAMAVGALYWTQNWFTTYKIAGAESDGLGNDSLKNDKHVESWWQMSSYINLTLNVLLTVVSCLAGAMGA